MSEHDEPTVAGELVDDAGAKTPLRVPVTVLGTADLCDVKIEHEAEVHCVLTVTPAGLALRSWHPDATLVNGRPTAAGLLHDGDELHVGPRRFRVACDLGEVVPLSPADEPVPVHEQHHSLAELVESRYRRICEWAEELADRREELRLYRARQEGYVAEDKAKAKRLCEQAAQLRRAAHRDRKRARAVYARFLKRLKARWSAERTAVEAERGELERARRGLAGEAARAEAEHARFAADAAAYQRRLRDAWELLAGGQRRLLADRQEAEKTLALREELLAQRDAELAARADSLAADRRRAEEHARALHGEVTRLEMRAAHARAVVQGLEERRAELEAGLAPPPGLGIAAETAPDRVPLAEQTGNPEEVLAALAVQQQHLGRERMSLASARTELDRRAATLADQRLVLAEQAAALVVARQAWQAAESRTVAELETLARGLRGRELELDRREREVALAEDAHRTREGDLAGLRARLEGWQTSLAAHEAAASAARDRAEAELVAKREHLARWEAAFAELCRKWSETTRRDRDALKEELARWAEARQAHVAALADLDRRREELAADASRVAGAALAAEEAQQQLAGGDRGRLARRKLRVHRRRWEKHFARFLKDLSARREAMAAESAAVEDRYRDLTRALADAAEHRVTTADAERAAEAQRLARARELDERAVILSIDEARAKRTEQELFAVRAEVERVAAALMETKSLPPPAADDEEPILLALPSRAA